jgi:hypothetical protein
VSEHDDQVPGELERRLDAAFQATRPRRGFEDELWARLRARRPWWRRLGDAPGHVPWAGVATAVGTLLLVGLVVTLVRAGGPHGGGGPSTTGASRSAEAPQAAPAVPGTSRADTAGGQAALPFGPLPAPAAAGIIQAVRPAGPSALPAGAQRVDVQGPTPPPVAPRLAVYRFDPATGPPNGSILDPGQVPAGLTAGVYPSLSAADAVAAAVGGGAGQAVVLTQARFVYVAVVSGGQGFLEPAYLYTGTAGSGTGSAPVQLVVSVLAPSALR